MSILASVANLDEIVPTDRSYLFVNGQIRKRPPTAIHGNEGNKFAYKPLFPERNEIRLLNLYGMGSTAGELRCQLRHVSLDNSPEYIALSYTWGIPDDSLFPGIKEQIEKPFSILCDWRPFNVTSNLYNALLHLRDGVDYPNHVWIDAICINQDDIEEKSRQIPLMRQIYESAHSVHVWLGDAHNDTGTVWGFVQGLLQASEAKDQANDTRLYSQLSAKSRHRYGFPEASDPGFRAFARFLDSPWCHRAWIIQEIAVAARVVLHRGAHSLPGEELILAFSQVTSRGIQAVLDFDIGSPDFFMVAYEYSRFKTKLDSTLLALMLRHRYSLATKPQDKVYALCGIAADVKSGKLNIPMDYNLPLQELFIATAKEIISADESLDALSAVAVSIGPDSDQLPSWVPNWANCQKDTVIWREPEFDFGYPHPIKFDATKGTKALPSFNGNRLLISGYFIGSVDAVGVQFKKEHLVPPYPSWETLAEARSKEQYFTGEGMLDVYYQTITMGAYRGTRDEWVVEFKKYDRRWIALRRFIDRGISASTFLVGAAYEKLLTTVLVHPLMGLAKVAYSRKLARTNLGLVALVPGHTEIGDQIAICRGGRVPLVFRKVTGGWRLIGDCYVHGFMNGTGIDEAKCESLVIF